MILLGEVVMAPELVAPYFGTEEKPECHLLYNVTTMATTWHTVATKDVRLLRKQLDIVSRLPKQHIFQNYLRCHDDIGWGLDYSTLREYGMEEVAHKQYLNDYFRGFTGSTSRGALYNEDPLTKDARFCGTTASLCGMEVEDNTEDAVRLDLMLHAMMFFQSGIPVLYSGDEIGQCNDWSYRDDPNKVQDSRYLHRGKMDWNRAEAANDPSSIPGQVFTGLKELMTLRKREKAFSAMADVWTWDTGSQEILGVGRWFENEGILGIFHFGNNTQTVALPEGVFRNLLTGRIVSETVTLDRFGFVWLKQEETV